MKNNRITWGIVALVVLITIAVSIGTLDSHSQSSSATESPTPTPDNNGSEVLSKYAVVDYDAPAPTNVTEREERKLKNKRYDNQDWVLKNPHPDDGGVGRFDEKTPVPLFPVDESDLVIVGKISNVAAYLSNDKSGVYSEFTIRADQILKNDASKKVKQGNSVVADREGGCVRYPNGQKVFYENSTKELPQVGREYVFFLTSDKKNPNYEILTLYELNGTSVIQLDYGYNFDDYRNVSKQNFIETIRKKISEASTDKESRRKP
jgi:hypothetical protein